MTPGAISMDMGPPRGDDPRMGDAAPEDGAVIRGVPGPPIPPAAANAAAATACAAACCC